MGLQNIFTTGYAGHEILSEYNFSQGDNGVSKNTFAAIINGKVVYAVPSKNGVFTVECGLCSPPTPMLKQLSKTHACPTFDYSLPDDNDLSFLVKIKPADYVSMMPFAPVPVAESCFVFRAETTETIAVVSGAICHCITMPLSILNPA